MTDINRLRAVDPAPFEEEESDAPEAPRFGIRLNSVLSVLRQSQKYSSYIFSSFFLVHGFNVLVAPAIDLQLAEEVMMMAREIYQQQHFESIAIYGSLAVHVASGLLIRIIKYLTRPAKPKHKKSQNNKVNLQKSIKLNSRTNEYEINDDSTGLGGWFSIFNFGLRRSLTTKLGLTPLQFSGYVLLPVLTYHILGERIMPLMVDGDSSLVSLKFVSHVLNVKNKYVVYPGFAVLIYVGLYHVIGGWLKWLKVYLISKKNFFFLVINGLTALGMFSLYSVSKFGRATGSIAKSYDLYAI